MNPLQQLALQINLSKAMEARNQAHREADEKCIADLRQLLARAMGNPQAPPEEVQP